MTALAITITPAGLAAAVNAANTGTGPLQITEIGLMSAPSTQIKRLATFAGESIADNIIHVTITDETTDTYTLTGIRLYTDTGILFATYDQAGAILEKGAQSLALISADILLTSVPAGSVTIGGTGFIYPGATTARQGVIEIATDAEVQTGTDTTRAVTPGGLQAISATTNPLVNGAASAGTSKRLSRGDHVHPTDTSRQAALGYTPVQQGTGVGQSGNVIKIGWSAGAKLKATVDNGDLGNIALETWVAAQIAALVNSSPGALDTLNELAAAIGNDANFATTITNLIAGKASKTGDTFTGPIAVSHATEAQMVARVAGQNDVILFSNSTNWGLYSNSGGTLVSFNRATGKMFFAGIDSAEIVRNNSGTYSINIAGDAGTVDGWNANDIRDWNNLLNKPGNFAYGNGGTYSMSITGNAGSIGSYTASQLWRADMASSWAGGFKLPNGWIIQMGKSPAQALGARPVTFPVSFPNAVLGISATKSHPSNGSVVPGTALSGNIPTLNGMTLGANDNAYDVFWIAIGN